MKKKIVIVISPLLLTLVFSSLGSCSSKEETKYKVSFNSNQGSEVPTQEIKSGEKATKPSDPTKIGYSFINWYKEESLTNVYDFSAPVTSSFTLFAKWNINQFTVTFNTNGGSEIAPQKVNYGDLVIKPNSPSKIDYSFVGWYTDIECKNLYNFETKVVSNFTLYALWSPLSFEEKLKNLKDVTSVIKLDEAIEGIFDECYTVKIKQCIDWKNQALGTFEQKFNIFYNKKSKYTMYRCNGYDLTKDKSDQFFTDEFRERYSLSVVDIEYRFFLNSRPKDFDPKGTKYYDYLNSYQASNDFNNIITSIQSILNNKTIFTGASKGGYATEALAYYFPNAIDAYISFVAPLCEGINDPNLYKYVYSTIGDKTYGESVAQKYRDLVSNIQIAALNDKFRDKVKSMFPKDYKEIEAVKINEMSEDELYENVVLEFAPHIWQYHGVDKFEEVQKILAMPENSEKEIEQKAKAIADIIVDIALPSNTERINLLPYFYQAYSEMGNYLEDYSYLRNKGANVKTDANRDKLINSLVNSTKVQRDKYVYSKEMRDSLVNFFNSTTKEIIKVVGYSDPWYGVKAPETPNKNIHLYEAKGNHSVRISNLDESKANECFQIIDRLLSFTPNN